MIELTKEGLEQLKKEYRYLLDEVRPEVIKEIVEARSMGDLSENAEYAVAREKQGKIESRIQEIEYILSNHKIIRQNKRKDVVGVGNEVTIRNLDKKTSEVYKIVGEIEVDVMNNKISFLSPLGSALMDKKVGDKIEVVAPRLKYKIEILEIN